MLQVLIIYVEYRGGLDNLVRFDYAVPFTTIVGWSGSRKDNARAIRYLISAQYFRQARTENTEYLMLTQKALDAYNAEYFLKQELITNSVYSYLKIANRQGTKLE